MKQTPFWWEDGTDWESDSIDLPTQTDVLVIGAGLSGLSAALTLAKAGKQVLVLDAGIPGQGASTRNGGMLGGGHRLSIDEMQARFGKDLALRLLQEAHIESNAYAIKLIREQNIECDLQVCGRFRGLWLPNEYEQTARGLERMQSLIPVPAYMLPKADQHQEIASDLYAGGMVFTEHAGLNPARYTQGLLRVCQTAGVPIQGQSAVQTIERQGAVFTVRVEGRHSIQAADILAATNGYTPGFLKPLKQRIIPIPSFIIATEELGSGTMKALIPNSRMLVESRERHCYFRPSPDGKRLIFGGRAAMTPVPEAFARHQLQKLMLQIFPQLDKPAISHSWFGYTGFSFDFLPHVGRYDGIWHAMGYSGSGNAMAPYLGHKAALCLLGDKEGETAFSQTPFSTRWWYQGYPWFRPFADALFRGRDVFNNIRRWRSS